MVSVLRRRNRRASGFTLLELVVVVSVLAVLSGLVLPKLDTFQIKANKGVAAANMHGVSRSIQQFRAQNNVYPDRWDSLLNGTALWVPGAPGGAAGLDPQLVGGPPAASPTKLTTTTIATDEELRSLTRVGISRVLDLDAASTSIPGNRFGIERTLAVGDTLATINTADEDGEGIIAHFYPNSVDAGGNPVVPSGKKLVVLGLGPRNSLIGTVLQETPTYANTDHTQYYDRMLAVFEISTGGSRAQLLGVVGGDADRLDEELNDFYER